MHAFSNDDQPGVIQKAMDGMPKIANFLGNQNYLTGDKVTMPDFILFEVVETILGLCHDRRLFQAHPNLEGFYTRIRALPTFAAYLNSPRHLAEPFFIPAAKVNMQMPQ